MNVMDANTVNAAAMAIGAFLVAVLVIVWFITRWTHRRWVCPECGFETYDEAHAMGHKAYHAAKHNPYEADP